MGYRLLGFVVWKVTTWFVRRRLGRYVPGRRVLSGLVVGAAVLIAAAFGARRSG